MDTAILDHVDRIQCLPVWRLITGAALTDETSISQRPAQLGDAGGRTLEQPMLGDEVFQVVW